MQTFSHCSPIFITIPLALYISTHLAPTPYFGNKLNEGKNPSCPRENGAGMKIPPLHFFAPHNPLAKEAKTCQPTLRAYSCLNQLLLYFLKISASSLNSYQRKKEPQIYQQQTDSIQSKSKFQQINCGYQILILNFIQRGKRSKIGSTILKNKVMGQTL